MSAVYLTVRASESAANRGVRASRAPAPGLLLCEELALERSKLVLAQDAFRA